MSTSPSTKSAKRFMAKPWWFLRSIYSIHSMVPPTNKIHLFLFIRGCGIRRKYIRDEYATSASLILYHIVRLRGLYPPLRPNIAYSVSSNCASNGTIQGEYIPKAKRDNHREWRSEKYTTKRATIENTYSSTYSGRAAGSQKGFGESRCDSALDQEERICVCVCICASAGVEII